MNFEKIRIIILSLLCVCCISYCRTSANAEELLNYSEEYVDLIQEGNYGSSSNVRKVEYYSLNNYTEAKNAIKDGYVTSIIPAYISDSKDDILEMKDKFNAAVETKKFTVLKKGVKSNAVKKCRHISYKIRLS